VRTVMLILGVLLLIGVSISCNGDSLAADKMVESFYEAINNGDTAKAQSYVSLANTRMLELTEAMVSVMAGKIQKMEILDIYEDKGIWGGPAGKYVYVRITCTPGVPTHASSNPGVSEYGKTCGDVTVMVVEYESGWKIEAVGDY